MDENYLDQLLKEVETQNTSGFDIDQSLKQEFVSAPEVEEQPEMELEQTLNADAEHIKDVAWSDSEIPVEEISDLDALDDLADLDMNAMDFDDIDFDDIDVTSMNANPTPFQKELENLDDLKIDEAYLDEADDQAFEQEFQRMKEEGSKLEQDDVTDINQESEDSQADDSFDVDALLQEVFGDDIEPSTDTPSEAAEETVSQPDTIESEAQPDMPDMTDSGMQPEMPETTEADTQSESQLGDAGMDDMEDLFAMLGIEGGSAVSQPIPETDAIPDFEIPEELADLEDIQDSKKKKKSFMDILFGEEEDDALTPEQEAELAKEKEEKRKAKLEKKEQQKAEKAKADAKKKSEKANKSAQVAAKKAARKAADEKALAEDGPEKKLNKPLSVIILLFFFAIGGFVIVGTNIFDYTLVISKATNYFERQKYGMAYREIIGVDVKEKDQPLEDKIYTVMYVERQYEAYENYVKMNRPDLALDALLQGLGKYDYYYADAVELGIEDDFNTAQAKIVDALSSVYQLDLQEAYRMLLLDKEEYTQQIQSITETMSFSTVEE